MANNRAIFSRQPARILMVDLSPRMDTTSCHNVCSTMEEFFSLICSLGGPCRVPFFGLFALGNFPDAVFPLQHVRGNFGRIQNAINEVKNFYHENNVSAKARDISESSIVQGLHEATAMFRRQSQSLLQSVGYWAQLEICIFTCENVSAIAKTVEKAARDISMDNLKKVQVVCMSNPERLNSLDEISASQGSNKSAASSSNSDLTGLVDFVNIDNDCFSLQNLLKGWLHDSGTDKEHLHISLPNPDGDDGQALVLKCDLQERILSPALLPFHVQYNLHPEAYASKSLATSNLKPGISVPLHHLNIISRIPTQTICESVLYGLPLIVRATSCWKIDWDELEVNQHHFHALCHSLNEKNEALLATLSSPETPAPPRTGSGRGSFQYQPGSPLPHGHFLLLPSHSDSLLLKAVAVSELLLPCQFSAVNSVDEDCQRTLEHSLQQLPCKETYNPLNVTSDLHPSLVCHLTKNLPNTGGGGTTRGRGAGGGPIRNKLSRSSHLMSKNAKENTGFQVPMRGGMTTSSNSPSSNKRPLMETGTVWGMSAPRPKPPPPPVQPYNLEEAFPTRL